ncbi:unnamed protein product [Oreochromis niloticus]|nr:unnamed protein product [Mustela putorius furo]
MPSDFLDRCLSDRRGFEQRISVFYNSIQEMSIPSTFSIKEEWEKEFGIPLSEDFWQEVLSNINTPFINSRHCLIQYKIIHRLHYSRERLHKMYPDCSPLCEKCMIHYGNLLHCFSLCPRLQGFWCDIFTYLSNIFKSKIEPNPIVIIFGISKETQNLQHSQKRFMSYALIIAKKLILQLWKGNETPVLKMWLTELTNTLHLEKIRYTMNDNVKDFELIWHPLLTYLGKI